VHDLVLGVAVVDLPAWLMAAAFFGGVLVLVWGIVSGGRQLSRGRLAGSLRTLLAAVACSLPLFFPAVALGVLRSIGALGRRLGGRDDQVVTATPHPVEVHVPGTAKAQPAGGDVDLGQVLTWVGVSVGVLAAVTATVAVAVFVARRVRAGRAAARTRAGRLTALDGRLAVVHGLFAAYECSLVDVFSRPALADVSVPATRALHEAFGRADDARTAVHAVASEVNVDRFADTVVGAERAWAAASAHAARVGLRLLPTEERRAVEKAIRLLNLAFNDSASAAERREAYERALHLVAGIVVVPKAATVAIEAQHRPAIPAVSTGSTR